MLEYKDYLLNVDCEDLFKYSEEKFSLKLADVQKDILRNICKGKNVITSRGIGRTLIVSLLAHYCAEKTNDLKMSISIIKEYEYNNYNKAADVTYSFEECVKAGLAPKYFFEQERMQLDADIFKKEYECVYELPKKKCHACKYILLEEDYELKCIKKHKFVDLKEDACEDFL